MYLDSMLNNDYSAIELRDKNAEAIMTKLSEEKFRYVIVSAGKWCERLLFFQKLSGIELIASICDNSKEKINTYLDEYLIKSVDDVAKVVSPHP